MRRGGEGPGRADAATEHALSGHAMNAVTSSALVVGFPVVRGRRVIAAIRVAEPIDVTDDQIRHQRLNIVWFAGAALIVALIVGLWLSAVLARPLGRLRVAAMRLGHGDFTVRAPRSGIAEPDAVAQALDETADAPRGVGRTGTDVQRARLASVADAAHVAAARGRGRAGAAARRPEHRVARSARRDRPVGADDHRLVAAVTRFGRPRPDRSRTWSCRRPTIVGAVPFKAAERPLRVASRPTSTLEAHASGAALGQILDVLLDNALKHGAGAVQLVLRPGTGGGAVIAVGGRRRRRTGRSERGVLHGRARWPWPRTSARGRPRQRGRGALASRSNRTGPGVRVGVAVARSIRVHAAARG